MRRLTRDHPLLCFSALACGLGWAPYAAAWLSGGAGGHNEPLGPALAAAIVCACAGREPLREWWQQLGALRAPAAGYALAVAAPLAIVLAAVLANRAFGAPLPDPGQLAQWPSLPVTFALFLLVVGFGEEAGWTAFAAPILLRRHGLLRAWGLASLLRITWHLPLVWTAQLSWPLGFVGNASFQLLVLWIYQRCGRRWFPAAIWHATLNTLGGGFFFTMVEGADRDRLGSLLALGYALVAAAVLAVGRFHRELPSEGAGAGVAPTRRTRAAG